MSFKVDKNVLFASWQYAATKRATLNFIPAMGSIAQTPHILHPSSHTAASSKLKWESVGSEYHIFRPQSKSQSEYDWQSTIS